MWGTIYIDSNPEPTIQSSPSPYVPPPPPPDNSENLPIIIGSSIGGFFALAISGLIIFMLYRRNKYQKQFEVAMQPYDPKLNAGGGNDRVNNLSDGNIGIPATSASSINLSRTNTNIYDDHSNNEVIASNISPNMTPSIVSNIVPNTQLNDETIRSYEERASNEYGVYRGTSKRDSLYHYNTSDGERSERSTISPPPTYPIQNPYNYNPNDEKYYLQQQQPQQPQQLPQQPPIPPRPTNIPPSQQQFGAPYLPPRPLAVNRFPPQYGPSSSPPPQEYQYNISSDPFGPANPGNYQQRQLRQSNLPRPPPPPPSQPPPSQPLPPPPTQQQTNQYIIDSAQYYNPNNSDI
ncbi:hypothetical protein RclHR1_29030001 [Rhizophagus clarus]|nr:hypothetical protein RclHR1_29030001 [Rhizophagus clarus]